MDDSRYSRQLMLSEIGPKGQERLARARVAVIGVGGLGSAAALYLAGAGVGTLVMADPDEVSLSNLQRQVLYSEADTGLPKTSCAARRLSSLNSQVQLICFPQGLTAENGRQLLAGCDLVVDCTDSYGARYLIDDLCASMSIPWVYGSISEFSGQLALLGGQKKLRYSDIFPEREELCSLPRRTQGVLGAVPGVIGAMQAAVAVSYLASGYSSLDGSLFSIDLLSFESSTIDF